MIAGGRGGRGDGGTDTSGSIKRRSRMLTARILAPDPIHHIFNCSSVLQTPFPPVPLGNGVLAVAAFGCTAAALSCPAASAVYLRLAVWWLPHGGFLCWRFSGIRRFCLVGGGEVPKRGPLRCRQEACLVG